MLSATTILLTDLPARLRLGVSPGERAQPQQVLISFEIDLAHAPLADRIGETLNYDDIIAFVAGALDAQGPFQLIETVAEACAAHVFAVSARVARTRVTVKKPSVLAPPALVAVTIQRTHADRHAERAL